ncbi:virulence factor Mce family protein [Mycobacterium avium]|uniref:virulence factor Mce family protein n=1 Tax=Mycobacterium avium TaxID=1764 RepID=UPI001CC4A85D|nr:virulence factor Mce family protein [Mycobacterium avium]MBZ4522636.1 MCE family protein [Mycobacterium avium subsp. hominissuis]MBZ4532824.1 MCE family protein [Mycobacterium avium subsp. hominissuis]
MRLLQASRRFQLGLMGVAVVLLITAVGQSFSGVPMLFATPTYYGQFANASGLKPGDKVRIDGIDVGVVRSTELEKHDVLVGFSLGARSIGNESRAAIRTETILGRKDLEIESRGTKPLGANGVLPLSRTSVPYQISDALTDVTKATAGWDLDAVRRSLDVLSETVDQTSPHLGATLEGVRRLSDTVAKRDGDIRRLVTNANKIAAVFGSRAEQFNELLVNARTLLAAFNARSEAVRNLLENVSRVSDQLAGFISENPNLRHVVEQLRVITDQLDKHKSDLADATVTTARFSTALGEVLASGPYFKVQLANLLPGQLLQPFIDAAFKKRGLDPEQFWRSAGLPAFRFPDPNGTRFPNGAPPPAPAPLEGTAEHPGPAVPPGSPCSYTPPLNGLPQPGDPLPCAHLDQGPYGSVPGGFGSPEVAASAPNPSGLPPSPGIRIAAAPGQPPPPVPGSPVALPPAPPGARTAPLGSSPQAPSIAPFDAPTPADSGGS